MYDTSQIAGSNLSRIGQELSAQVAEAFSIRNGTSERFASLFEAIEPPPLLRADTSQIAGSNLSRADNSAYVTLLRSAAVFAFLYTAYLCLEYPEVGEIVLILFACAEFWHLVYQVVRGRTH